jgi:NhaP-type Na+/H+ or K+/H+ antiporter
VETILSFAAILLLGLLAARLLRQIKFPAVTAYLLLGILIGPEVLSLVARPILGASGPISNVVLSFVAFSLGQEFSRENFSRIGKSVLWVSLLAAIGAWLLVTFSCLYLLGQSLALSLLLGSIASATAPAATVMVVRESGAKGTFTDTLLGVVAIDDAWCLIIFAVSLALAKGLTHPGGEGFHLSAALLRSLLEIGGALALGTLVALILTYFSRYIRSPADLLVYTLGFILLNTGLAMYFHLSVLLASMFLGMMLINTSKMSFRFFDIVRTVDSPLYLAFFVLAGANLEIHLLGKLGLVGLAYFVFRILGKVGGASLGGWISRAARPIKKYLGFALIPQAGVALGVALIAKAEFPLMGGIIFTTILTTTIIYEIVGPFFTRWALHKADEISRE